MELVGRDLELAEILARIEQGRRLVTIVGTGGIGKTTIAKAALARLTNARMGPPAVVELSRTERPDQVAGALAAQLGFPSFEVLLASPDLPWPVVLIDNCEHVLDSAAEALGRLLEQRPGLSVLATSRSPLELASESIVALAPLAVPSEGRSDATCASLRLFVERARDAGARLSDDDLPLAAEVCRRLDGMPLALELAAARLRTMSLGELAATLADGIDLLSRPRLRGAGRHRSVRETIEWSMALLPEPEQLAFITLGLCPGWFRAELGAALMGAEAAHARGMIDRLVDASLLEVDRRSVPSRYRMLQPIRAVATEAASRMGVRARGFDRLANHLVAEALAQLEAGRRHIGADAAAAAVERFDQLDLAMRHCLEADDDPRRARVLCAILWGVVQQARLDDVSRLGELLIGRWPNPSGPFGADAASVVATARLFHGDLAGARTLARSALEYEGDSVFAAVTLRRALGHIARFERRHAEAADWFEAASTAGFDRGIPTLAIASTAYQAQDVAATGRVQEALDLIRGAVSAAVTLGSPLTELLTRTVEASILSAGTSAQRALASQIAEANLAVAEASQYPVATLANLQTLAACALLSGDTQGGARAAARLVDASGRAGPGDLRRALELAVVALFAVGDQEARHLAATAEALPNTSPMTLGVPIPSLGGGRVLEREVALGLARQRLGAIASSRSAQPDPGATSDDEAAFVQAGDVWHVTFRHVTAAVAASKGMADLAVLLAQPGRDIPCLDLAGAAVEDGDTGELIDASARREYEARARGLREVIDEAEANHDTARVERARAELDAIVDHLAAALGLAGKRRKTGSTAERARSAVTHRIRAALRRIGEAHPPAGQHLERAVITGFTCRYEPERPIRWRL